MSENLKWLKETAYEKKNDMGDMLDFGLLLTGEDTSPLLGEFPDLKASLGSDYREGLRLIDEAIKMYESKDPKFLVRGLSQNEHPVTYADLSRDYGRISAVCTKVIQSVRGSGISGEEYIGIMEKL